MSANRDDVPIREHRDYLLDTAEDTCTCAEGLMCARCSLLVDRVSRDHIGDY